VRLRAARARPYNLKRKARHDNCHTALDDIYLIDI
jgi:hypothetical protein